ncbi:Solute carrier organic anion transporter family member 4A1, partial [Stegodyphus mimosarum]
MKADNHHRTVRTSSSIGDAYDIHESHSHEPLVAQAHNLEDLSGTREDKLEEDDDEDDEGAPCGWGRLQPTQLQKFRSARWVLFWLCWAGFLQGLIVNGFINVVITTIEKRYQLRSTESGLIAGGYDIASFLCLVPVSYLGGSRSKPVFIGSGVLILALGSFVFSLPHYMSGPYSFSQEREDLCAATNNSMDCSGDGGTHLSQFKYVFFLGQLLHGAGAAPFYTLGCTYLDENVSTKMSSVYLGIYYTMAVIGPAVGYLIGGQFLKIYVDIGVDPTELGLTSSSSVWVGAWWIGFIFTAILGALVAIPLTAFPKTLPGALRIKAEKKTEMHQKLQNSEAVQTGFGTSLRDLPSSLRFLLTNPTFVFLSLAGATEGMLVSGLATFLPKVIESQFSIAASWAAVLVGLVTIPGAGGGTFLGGYLVKKLNLRCAGIIKMCIIFSFICVGLVFIFILHCPNAKFAGLNHFLPNSSEPLDVPKFRSSCNANCYCSPRQYDPICGTDNVVYYSPCFAGCANTYQSESTKVYGDCTCIQHEGRNLTIQGQNVVIQATREKCANYCSYMPAFLLLIFLSMLFTFLVSMPSLSGTLRCVAESQKSFALGV